MDLHHLSDMIMIIDKKRTSFRIVNSKSRRCTKIFFKKAVYKNIAVNLKTIWRGGGGGISMKAYHLV